jgi:hypothetical protein
MKKLGTLLTALVLAAVAACATDDAPQRPLPKPVDPPTSISDLVECRNVEAELVGRLATIYRALDAPDMFVLILEGDPTCATDESGVIDSHVVPDTTPVEAARCPICAGQPMPAGTFPGLQ